MYIYKSLDQGHTSVTRVPWFPDPQRTFAIVRGHCSGICILPCALGILRWSLSPLLHFVLYRLGWATWGTL